MSINDLYNNIGSGDETAEQILFNRLSARFRVFAQHKILDKQDAEEVVQEALLTIAEKYREIEFNTSFASWAYQVLENKILGFYRKKYGRDTKFKQWEKDKGQARQIIPEPELKLQLLRCLKKIGRINQRHARILNLHYQGFAVEEICEKMKITKGNLYSILSRVRSLLQLCLEKGL